MNLSQIVRRIERAKELDLLKGPVELYMEIGKLGDLYWKCLKGPSYRLKEVNFGEIFRTSQTGAITKPCYSIFQSSAHIALETSFGGSVSLWGFGLVPKREVGGHEQAETDEKEERRGRFGKHSSVRLCSPLRGRKFPNGKSVNRVMGACGMRLLATWEQAIWRPL